MMFDWKPESKERYFRKAEAARRWWEAKRTIENMHEVPTAKDQFGRKHKSIFIHAFMILEMEEQDK